MAAPMPTAAEYELRVQRIARMIAAGGKRSDCLQFAASTWGIETRTADRLIARARELIKADWKEVHRDQMLAELLSQYSTLQMEARRSGQLNVVLGCIHGMAKLTNLLS
jgi:hypothetical protein